MTSRSLYYALGLAVLPAVAISCAGDVPTTPESLASSGPELARMPCPPGSASERQFFKVQLAPLGESRARGTALIDVVGGVLRVRIHSNGVEPGEHIPQHIHVNDGCENGGAILINLDAGLALPSEAPGVGAAYPVANGAGVLKYEATRSLADLRAGWNSANGTTFETDDALLAALDLENRNVHQHVAFGPPFPAVNCGPVDLVN